MFSVNSNSFFRGDEKPSPLKNLAFEDGIDDQIRTYIKRGTRLCMPVRRANREDKKKEKCMIT